MADSWSIFTQGNPLARIENAYSITPDDGADLAEATRSIHIGSGGALKVTLVGGTTVTYPYIEAGRHVLGVARVFATGTTAGDLTAEY